MPDTSALSKLYYLCTLVAIEVEKTFTTICSFPFDTIVSCYEG